MPDLIQLPAFVNMLLFGAAAAGVWIAGTRLSIYAEEISDRRRIGKALMGLIFLAGATSLPEIVTTITASLENNAALALNNLFGGIALQTAILAAADGAARNAPLTHFPRKLTPVLEASSLVILLALLQGIIILGDRPLALQIGIGTVVLTVAYLFSIYFLRRFDKRDAWLPVALPEESDVDVGLGWIARLRDVTSQKLTLGFLLAAAAVLTFGVLLVETADALAVQTGLGSSFVGVTLLAASTSLPELSTTIMAVRLRSYTMAISNIFGSNLIMVVLVLPADIFYRPGPILAQIDPTASFALISGLMVTVIYIVGLVVRSNRQIFGLGLDSAAVLVIYCLALVAFYNLR